jgi:hypothetical protein
MPEVEIGIKVTETLVDVTKKGLDINKQYEKQIQEALQVKPDEAAKLN